MKKWISLIVLLTSCHTTSIPKDKPRPVRYVVVEEQIPITRRSFAGISVADIEAKLSFRVNGTIEKLYFTLGDFVKKGDLLAKLDSSDFQIKVKESEASLLNAEAQERKAEADYKRIQDLYVSRSSSKAELDAARAASESAKATVESTRQQLAYARRELSYTKLYAPIDGTIAQKSVEVNENVQPGQAILTLSSTGFIEVSIAIPESLIGEVKRGEVVLVKFDSIPGKTFQATVHEVSATSLEGSTFPVKVRLNDSDPSLRSGMAAEVIFTFTKISEKKAMYVPSEAVLMENGANFVYIAIPESGNLGEVEKREVKVGTLTNQGLVITEGVEPGEIVITAGIHFLKEGMKVIL